MELSVKDVARLLTVSEKTIYRWIKQESIPSYRINEQYRFNHAEILEWATLQRIQFSPAAPTATHNGNGPLPTLVEAMNAGGIAYKVGGTDKESVLHAVVGVMHLPKEVDREFLFQVLLAREALGSTGIGDGIAIPHVRNPIVLHITQPSITLCFLAMPINFEALDGDPVDTLFTLISPTVRTHLHLLSRLSFVLRNPEYRAALKRRATRDELLATMAVAEAALPHASTGLPASG